MKSIRIKCINCGATGIYKGFAEKDGAGIICSECNGNGYRDFKYEEFDGLQIKDDVKRVYERSGYIISDKDILDEEGNLIRFGKYGCSYAEWLNGIKPTPIKDLCCPYEKYNKGVGNEPLQRCKENCTGFGLIKDCSFWRQKHICWEEYSELNK